MVPLGCTPRVLLLVPLLVRGQDHETRVFERLAAVLSETTAILIMPSLIRTLLIITIHKILNTGGITYNLLYF
jgi:hypothetical protein